MPVLTLRRRLSATLSVALLTLILAACGSAAGSPPASQAPASPSLDPGPAIDTDALVDSAAERDGKAVRVVGFFLAAGDTAQLCSLLLESYPPQCGGRAVRITGEVPGDVLALLEKTTEPDIAQATWGWVVVEGTFRASGVGGQPTIELGQVILAEG
jgi:hypothetical protein